MLLKKIQEHKQKQQQQKALNHSNQSTLEKGRRQPPPLPPDAPERGEYLPSYWVSPRIVRTMVFAGGYLRNNSL